MPAVIATCQKCGTQYSWNTDFQDYLDCPKCGYNPNQQFRQAGFADLIEKLKSRDSYVSSNAAAELGKRGDRRAVEPLIKALKNKNIQLAVVIALEKIPDERAVEPLMSVFREDKGPSLSAADALVNIGGMRVIKLLIVASKDRNEAVRKHAAKTLGRITVKPLSSSEGKDFDAELLKLLREGRKIVAIKLRHGLLGEGVKEAKDYVEKLVLKHESVPQRTATSSIQTIPAVSKRETEIQKLFSILQKIIAFKRGQNLTDPVQKNLIVSSREDNDKDEELLRLMYAGRKVAAIKLRRKRTGQGLKEAKDYVEKLTIRQEQVRLPFTSSSVHPEDEDYDAELLELLHTGHKVTAIKLRRELSGEGLREAKEYVEELAHKHRLTPKPDASKPKEVPGKMKKCTESGTGLCDICNCELDSQKKTIVKTDIIREATANGYLPPIAKSMNSELLQFGMSGKDMWKNTIEAGSATNWALCSECYKEIKEYAQPDDSTMNTPVSKGSAMEMKKCTQCNTEFEALRHSCPKCGSTMFAIDQDEADAILGKQVKAAELVTQGERLIQAGKFKKAEQTLRHAIKINPYNETAYGNLGGVFYFLGKYAEAIPWMEKALEINPRIAGIPEALQNARAKVSSSTNITRKDPDYKTVDTHKNERNLLWDTYWIILFLMFLSGGIYQYFWLYRVFKELHARKATALSPGRAAGYMFIPFFNLVWIFIVWKKLGDAIVSAYSQAGFVPPKTSVVWIPPISYWLVIVLYVITPTDVAVGIIFFLVLLSAVIYIIKGQMNRLTGKHGHKDTERSSTTKSRRSFLKPECKVKQRVIVLGSGHHELAAALGSSGSPVISGETVANIKRQMPEVCPHCSEKHNCLWVIGFCGFQVPGREGRASSEPEIKKWGDRYLDLFRERGGRQLLKDQEKKEMLEWFWDMSTSSGSLVIKCNPGGSTSWLYELLALMAQTAAELSGKKAASYSEDKDIDAEKHVEQLEVKQKDVPPPEPTSSLDEALLSNDRELAAEAARKWSMLRENDPELAAQLIPAANEAAKKAFETIWNLLKNGKTVGESEAFQLASFGDAASSYAPILQKQIKEAGENAIQNPWLIGALACMAPGPKPYFSTLLESMRNADEGQVEAPLPRIQANGSVQMVRDVYSGDLGAALGYISAWGANKPAANSQDSMLRALSILGEEGRNQLQALRKSFPSQVDGLLNKVHLIKKENYHV